MSRHRRRSHPRYRKFKQVVATHKPHLFATGAVLSAAATAAGAAAGVVSFKDVWGLGPMLCLATVVFLAMFFGTIIMKKRSK